MRTVCIHGWRCCLLFCAVFFLCCCAHFASWDLFHVLQVATPRAGSWPPVHRVLCKFVVCAMSRPLPPPRVDYVKPGAVGGAVAGRWPGTRFIFVRDALSGAWPRWLTSGGVRWGRVGHAFGVLLQIRAAGGANRDARRSPAWDVRQAGFFWWTFARNLLGQASHELWAWALTVRCGQTTIETRKSATFRGFSRTLYFGSRSIRRGVGGPN